jgi:hypothetical protein
MNVAAEVGEAPNEPGEGSPAVVARTQRSLADRDVRMARGEVVRQLRVARVLLEPREGEVDAVAVLGEPSVSISRSA